MEQKLKEKYYPTIGDHLYLSQLTGNYYVDMVKTPYTVIDVTPSHVVIQEAKMIFDGPRYYDTICEKFEENHDGEILQLNWAPKKGWWQIDKYKTGYPEIAHFGEWKHYPYLD